MALKWNKKCLKCGTVNKRSVKSCVNCGTKFNKNNNIRTLKLPDNVEEDNDSKVNGDKIAFIAFLLFLIVPYVLTYIFLFLDISSIFSDILYCLFFLLGIVVMIVGRVKYPANKSLKAVMWFTVIFAIWFLLPIIYWNVACSGIY